MRMVREWIERLRGTLQPSRPDHDLAEELRAHVELAADEARRRGAAPAEAGRAARLEAGSQAAAMEALRDQRGVPWADDILRDVRHGMRLLRRSPVFAAVAILSLALGIGANAAIFHLIDTVVLRTLPVADPHELAEVRAEGVNGFGISEGGNAQVTYPLWEQIRAHQAAFSEAFAWGNAELTVGRGAQARAADGLWVSGAFFRALGVRPVRGRLLSDADDRPGCPPGALVLSHAFWQAALGGSESAVGSTVTISGRPFTVVGVAAPDFTGLEVGRAFDVAVPICSAALWNQRLERRDLWWLTVMGRLAPGWTLERASEHLRTLSPGLLEATIPPGYSAELIARYRGFRFEAIPAARGVSRLRDAVGAPLSLLLGLTALVLLIMCGNLATLMLARAGARTREIAIRVALGASRRRVVSQLTVESLLLAVAGAAAAVPVALSCGRALVAFLDRTASPVDLALTIDWRLIAFVSAAAGVTTVVFGLAPALRASMIDPLAATGHARGPAPDPMRARFRRGLVAAQVALALVLMVSAALFVRTLHNLAGVDLGFDPNGVVVASFRDDASAALPVEQRVTFQERLTGAIQSVPGVTAAAASSHVLLSGGTWAHFFKVPGVTGDDSKVSRFVYVSPTYFDTLKVPIRAGRAFDRRDTANARRVLLVNESFVRSHLGGGNAIGATLRTIAEAGYPETAYEVVGVVGDTKYTDLRDEDCWCDAGSQAMPPIAYVPIAQDPSPFPWANVIVRTSGPAATIAPAIRQRVEALNPAIAVSFTELTSVIRERLVMERMMAWLAGAFGVLAIGLVVVGLYGVIAYLTVTRRNEIGIRLSLGSTRAQIVGLVLGDSARMVAAGLIAGVLLAAAAARAAGALLFGLSPTDVPTIAGAVVLLAAIAALAASIPAWRASRLDPNAVLRAE